MWDLGPAPLFLSHPRPVHNHCNQLAFVENGWIFLHNAQSTWFRVLGVHIRQSLSAIILSQDKDNLLHRPTTFSPPPCTQLAPHQQHSSLYTRYTRADTKRHTDWRVSRYFARSDDPRLISTRKVSLDFEWTHEKVRGGTIEMSWCFSGIVCVAGWCTILTQDCTHSVWCSAVNHISLLHMLFISESDTHSVTDTHFCCLSVQSSWLTSCAWWPDPSTVIIMRLLNELLMQPETFSLLVLLLRSSVLSACSAAVCVRAASSSQPMSVLTISHVVLLITTADLTSILSTQNTEVKLAARHLSRKQQMCAVHRASERSESCCVSAQCVGTAGSPAVNCFWQLTVHEPTAINWLALGIGDILNRKGIRQNYCSSF